MPNNRKPIQEKKESPQSQTRKTPLREIIILIIAVVLAGYLGYNIYDKNAKFKGEPNSQEQVSGTLKNNKTNTQINNTGLPNIIKELNGSWNNNEGGSSLNFTNNQYSIYFESVEGGKSLKGAFRISGDTLFMTANSNSQLCPDENGLYIFKIENGTLMADMIKDNCVKRASRMKKGWRH